MFHKNVGERDARIRRILGIILFVAAAPSYFLVSGGVGAVGAAVAAGLGLVMLVTSTARVCPLYLPIGIDTRER